MVEKLRLLKTTNPGTTFSKASPRQLSELQDNLDNLDDQIGLLRGAIIGGIYEIIELIGRGGMGEVYLVQHLGLGKKCALKVIPPQNVDEIGWQRFQLEAKAVSKLAHINLVRVTDLGIHDGCLPYYAMDFVAGITMADFLAESGRIRLDKTLDIFIQICDALEYAHKNGIIHRDLKPANIIIADNKVDKLIVKVLDFGLAKLIGDDRNKQSLTSVGDIFGSPFYMSPEQCSGEKRVDGRSDIYSIGCTLYEALTGRPPFTGHLPAAIVFSHQESPPPSLADAFRGEKMPDLLARSGVLAAMELIMTKLLRKIPSERYQNFGELREDLLRVKYGDFNIRPYYLPSRKENLPQSSFAENLAGRVGEAAVNQSGGPAAATRYAILRFLGALSAVLIIIGLAIFSLDYFGFHLSSLHLSKSHDSPSPAIAKKTNSDAIASSAAPKEDASLSKSISAEDVDAGVAVMQSVGNRSGAENLQPISEIISEKDSAGKTHEIRQFTFPVGKFFGYFGGRARTKDGQTVEGVRRYPAASHLIYRPNYDPNYSAEFYKRFRSGDIYGLQVNNVSYAELKALSNIVGVKSLDVSSSADLDDGCISVLDKFANLEYLTLADVDITGRGLALYTRLKNLAGLSLVAIADCNTLCGALKGSSALVDLTLHDVQLSPESFNAMGTLKKLRSLRIFVEPLSDDKLAALAGCTSLEYLDVSPTALTPAQIVIVKKMHTLKHLRMGEPAEAVGSAYIKGLPGVRVDMVKRNFARNGDF